MVKRLFVPALALLLGLCPAAAHAEPRPGTVAGLDLSSPESAARSFLDAWRDADYFVAWLALDPELRFRFEEMLMMYNVGEILGGVPPEGFFARIATFTEDSQRPGGATWVTVDRFADFSGFMQAASAFGIALPVFGQPAGGGEGKQNFSLIALDAGGTLVLRQSPGGLWRVAGISDSAVPAFWAFTP